jgi:hypothetical protein
VAETITTAADPEANIIFGATINPDLEGEVIVTVVATGFDDAYFATRDAKAADLLKRSKDSAGSFATDHQVDEETIAGIDMDLKDQDEGSDVHDFHKDDDDTPNIWALHDENQSAESDETDEELDKPSFLRRFTRRSKAGSEEEDDVQPSDDKEEPDADEVVSDAEDEDKDEPAADTKKSSKKSTKSKSK